jgi:chromosome segregation ATPase
MIVTCHECCDKDLEIMELRQKREDLQTTVAEQQAKIWDYDGEVHTLEEQLLFMEEEKLTYARDLLTNLIAYTRHLDGCLSKQGGSCRCGLEFILETFI